MNQKQKEYAADRISSIKKAKLEALKVQHTTKGKHLSDPDKNRLIRDGKVKLRSDKVLSEMYPRSLYKVFDFSKYGTNDNFDQKAYDVAAAKVHAEAARLTDELMLGDAKSVLQAIRDFEAM